MRIIILCLVLVFISTPSFAWLCGTPGVKGTRNCPVESFGDRENIWNWNKEEDIKLSKMTEKERESYELNKWFEETEKESK